MSDLSSRLDAMFPSDGALGTNDEWSDDSEKLSFTDADLAQYRPAEPGSPEWAKRLSMQASDRRRLAWEAKQAVARGYLKASEVDAAYGLDRSSAIQKWMGFAAEKNDGSVMQSLSDVLFSGLYATASLSKARAEADLYDTGPKDTQLDLLGAGLEATSEAVFDRTLGISKLTDTMLQHAGLPTHDEDLPAYVNRVVAWKAGITPEAYTRNWKNKTTYFDIFNHYQTFGEEGGWGNIVAGLTFDIGMDPTMLLTFGVGKGSQVVLKGGESASVQRVLMRSLTDDALLRGATHTPEGAARLTLQRIGQPFYRAAMADMENTLKAQHGAHEGWRVKAGLPDSHLLDAKLSADMSARITEHMIVNFDRLKEGVQAARAKGQLGKGIFGVNWSKGTRYLPGSLSFEARVTGTAEKAAGAVGNSGLGRFLALDKAGEVLSLHPEDLFYETASVWRRDLGVGNAFGLGHNTASMRTAGRAMGATGAMSHLGSTFKLGAGVSEDVMDTARVYQHTVDDLDRTYRETYHTTFKALDGEERVALVHAMEARAQTLVHLPPLAPGYNQTLVKDLQGNLMTTILADGSKQARTVQTRAAAGDVLAQGSIGGFTPLKANMENAAIYFANQMDDILHADRAAGYPTYNVEAYVSHITTDPKKQSVILDLVARRNGVDSIKSANRMVQARNIATIHDAENLFEQGSMLVDPERILYLRRMASVQMLNRGKFLADIERKEGIVQRFLIELKEGIPLTTLKAAARRIGVGNSHVMQLDQVYKAEYSRLRSLGFGEGEHARNRVLLEYLMQPPTREGRYALADRFDTSGAHARPAWTKVAEQYGFNEEAQLFTHAGQGLPKTIDFKLPARSKFVPGVGHTDEALQAEGRTMEVIEALKILDNPNHAMWRRLLTSDEALQRPQLKGVQSFLKSLDSYFVKHLDAPLEAFYPQVRMQVEAAWNQVVKDTGRIKGPAKQDIKDLRALAKADSEKLKLPASVTEQLKVLREQLRQASSREEIARIRAEIRAVRPPASPAERLTRATISMDRANARMMEVTKLKGAVGEHHLAFFNKWMDGLSANRELRRMVPQLPTPLVNYLKQQRRMMGISTEIGPPSAHLMDELRVAMGRLGIDANGLRQISEVYLDKPAPATYHDVQSLVRLFSPKEAALRLQEMELVTLHMQRPITEATAFAAEEVKVLGSLDHRGRYTEVLQGAEAGVKTEAAKAAIREGQLPPEETIIKQAGNAASDAVDAAPEQADKRALELINLRQQLSSLGQRSETWKKLEVKFTDANFKLRFAQRELARAKVAMADLKGNFPRDANGKLRLDRESRALWTDLVAKRKAANALVQQRKTELRAAVREKDTLQGLYPQLKTSPRFLDREVKRVRHGVASLQAALAPAAAPTGAALKKQGGLQAAKQSPRVLTRQIKLYLPQATTTLIKDMFAPSVDPAWHPMIRKMVLGYDSVINLFKASWILPWLGSWARDIISTTGMVSLANGVSMFHPKRGKTYWNVMKYILSEPKASEKLIGVAVESAKREALGNMTFTFGNGRTMGMKELIHEMRVHGVFRTHVASDVVNGYNQLGRFGSAMVGGAAGMGAGATAGTVAEEAGAGEGTMNGLTFAGTLLGMLAGGRRAGEIGKILDPATHMLQTNWAPLMRHRERATEIPFRVMTFLHGLEETGSVTHASEHLYKHLNDYNMLSAMERRLFRRAIPFYQWTKTAFKHNLAVLVDHPERLSALLKSANLWNKSHGVDPEDVPDSFQEALYLAAEPYQEEGFDIMQGFGMSTEDTARLLVGILPGTTDAEKEFKELRVEAIRRTGPIFGQLLSLATNTDPMSGRALYDTSNSTERGSLSRANDWATAPLFVRTMVNFQPAGPGKVATVDPRVVWALRAIPVSRFVNLALQIRQAPDPSVLNYRHLSRTLLGASLYRVDPRTEQYYENEQRLQKVELLLRNIGVGATYPKYSDRDRTDQDYQEPNLRRQKKWY